MTSGAKSLGLPLPIDGEVRPASRAVSFLLIGLPYVLVLGAVTPPQIDNWLPATTLFEVSFFLAALSLVMRISKGIGWVFLLSLGFAAIHMGLAQWGGVTPLDESLRAHKWIFYIIALCCFVGQRLSSPDSVTRLTKFFIIAAFLKYSYGFVFLGLTARPAILTENNYELFLFMGLLVVSYQRMGSRAVVWVMLLGLTVLESGSRSGAVGFVVLVVFVALSGETVSYFRRYLWSLVSVAVVLIPVFIFQSRGTSVDNLDRLNFLNQFLGEVTRWGPIDWLIGSPPLTQLSYQTCQKLSFYNALLSSSQDGSCYSVILHSFLLRVVFDFGVLGLLASIVGLWIIMAKGKVGIGIRVALIALGLANAFSVSGPNNVYVILPIAYALLNALPTLEQSRQSHAASSQPVVLGND